MTTADYANRIRDELNRVEEHGAVDDAMVFTQLHCALNRVRNAAWELKRMAAEREAREEGEVGYGVD